MNSSVSAIVSRFLLTAHLACVGCVLRGTIDEADTEGTTAGDESGSASTADASDTPASSSVTGGPDSGTTLGDGEELCADFIPPPLECVPVGLGGVAHIAYSTDFAPFKDDMECTVVDIGEEEMQQTVDFECSDGMVALRIYEQPPQIVLPFAVGEATLLTVHVHDEGGHSVAVRSAAGELLLGYVDARGLTPGIDLGTIDLVPGSSGCGADEYVVPCGDGGLAGSLLAQRIPLTLASPGPIGMTVFDGSSVVIEDQGRPFLLIVNRMVKTICWDDGCFPDPGTLGAEGGMSYFLVAVPVF